MNNLNSLLDITRNSLVFNNSNNLLNNNFNNNTSITILGSISNTNCESKHKPELGRNRLQYYCSKNFPHTYCNSFKLPTITPPINILQYMAILL